jgi:fructosamine-3-kinase
VAEHLRHAIEEEIGQPVVGLTRVGGGSINEAYDVHLRDGTRLFCKSHPSAPPDFFAVEAAGLTWLAEAGAVQLPAVQAVRSEAPAFLALEWIEPGRHGARTAEGEERLGRELAALHRSGAPGFGWERDGYVGDLPQANTPLEDWGTFYLQRRIEPLVRQAIDGGQLPATATAALDRWAGALAALVGPPEPPARLHGDLWGGNLVYDRDGAPWLVDPAPYGGHREVDLAMMRLFGGFGRRVFEAYAEVSPLAPGHEDRVGVYQLYPLLVHTVLFGGSYAHQALEVLHRYG